MKCITFCSIALLLGLNSYSQADTSRKPIDTLKPRPADTLRQKPVDTPSAVPVDTLATKPVDTLGGQLSDTTQKSMVATQSGENQSSRGDSAETTGSLNDRAKIFSYIDNNNVEVYRLKPAVDIPLVVAGTAWSLYGFSKIYNKPSTPEARIYNLRKSDLNGFDRWAADVYNDKAEKISDIPFYAAMPLPLLLLIDKDIRKDGWKYLFLYWETMAVQGILYTGTPYIIDRYRPLAYNPDIPMYERTSGNARNSFYAGHVGLVATSTFFIAKVYSDYHPDSKFKWLFYTGAAGATVLTGYLRHAAAKHFPSDIVVGTVIGTLNGILVPHFHKNPILKKRNLTIRPFTGQSHGVYISYKW